jgi:hypothetical protein
VSQLLGLPEQVAHFISHVPQSSVPTSTNPASVHSQSPPVLAEVVEVLQESHTVSSLQVKHPAGHLTTWSFVPSSNHPSGAVQRDPSLAGSEVTQVSQEIPSLQVPHTDKQVAH